MKKLAVLTNELPPYRRPIFEQLGRHDALEVTVYLSTRVEPHRMWDPAESLPRVKVETVPSFALNVRQSWREHTIYFPIGALYAMLKKRPDAVISGEFGFRTLLAWLYCALFRKPLIIWSGETPLGARLTATGLHRVMRRFLSRRADGFLAYGEASRHYLHSLNVEDRKISIVAQAVDNDYWGEASRAADPGFVRSNYEIRGKIALCVANLLYPKGIHHLIDAWAALPRPLQVDNTLLVVGGGSEKERLEEQAARLNAENVVFAGAVGHQRLSPYYAAADFFVFPTLLDVWGLVVNEAMACGLPVLCSKYAGCAEELIVPGQTGEIFDPTDTQAFSTLLAEWLDSTHETPDPAIQAHIQHWNFERSVDGILEQLTRVGVLPEVESA